MAREKQVAAQLSLQAGNLICRTGVAVQSAMHHACSTDSPTQAIASLCMLAGLKQC